ncbi:MAG TPA: peptidylprolyl isomerase [Tepidisphaeraceae bacterium]
MPSQPNVSKAAPKKIWLAIALIAGCEAAQKQPPVVRPDMPPAVAPTPSTATPAATRPAGPGDDVIAVIGTTQIKRSALVTPLMEAYGFNLLMLIVQRDMARDACAQQGIVVSPSDVKWEHDWTINQMFPTLAPTEDRDKILEQFLAQPKPRDQTTTRAEFDVIIDTNAHLRKLVEPSISRGVNDELLQQQFDEAYGSQVKVRHIVVANPQEATDVRRRLDGGEDFATVARQISRDPQTKRLGGELAPFGLNNTRLPENFKRVAFAMKPGEVSDPVQAAGGYHLIKLEQRIAPKAVKFEDVKESLREDYKAKLVVEGVKALRTRLAQQALAQLSISDPILKAEFDKRLAARDQVIRDREKMREQMEKDRAKAAAPPADSPTTSTTSTQPTTAPDTVVPAPAAVEPIAPATAPATRPAPMPDTTSSAVDPIAPPTQPTEPAMPATHPTAGGQPTPPAAQAPASQAPAAGAPAADTPAPASVPSTAPTTRP